MPGFTKLFNTILSSTIWGEPDQVRIVWITMLALADQYGKVYAAIPGLAHQARISLEGTIKAIEVLEGPDSYSRTDAHEGRRIKPIDGGWLILNYVKYREARNEDERREYLRQKQQEHRDRKKKKPNGSTGKEINHSLEATEHVMSECNFTDERLKAKLQKVLDAYRIRENLTAYETAKKMIQAWADYVKAGELLRYSYEPLKFFEQGHWLTPQKWPMK